MTLSLRDKKRVMKKIKPLKILIANNTLAALAGSETWTYTLAVQLKKMGHTVVGFSPELGIISDNLKREEIPCVNVISESGVKPFSVVLEETPIFDFDVIIANHWHIVEFLRKQYPKIPIISTIHGILHKMQNREGKEVDAPEHPALTSGVNQFVAVSEEVKELLKKEYNIDALVVRNFFDIDSLKTKKPSKKPKQILLNSNYSTPTDPDVLLLKEVAKHYGAKLIAIGVNFTPSLNIDLILKDVDIVIGMGRSVLEGVAAGRLGMVHGRWGTGGVVCEQNVQELQHYNFSGRNSGGIVWTKEQFIEAIDKFYNKENLEWGRNYILREHNVKMAADFYVNIARDLLGQTIVKEIPLRPYRRAKDVESAKN